ncbi:hypothetical protein L7F22_005633 [Adiantum nelumboides]|nr:hypothetical protein [Adiantum nelumboides]
MKKRNTTRAKALGVQACKGTQDASQSMPESEITTIEHELVLELGEELKHIEEEQQNKSTHYEEQQQKDDDMDLDKAKMEMVISKGNDVIAQCRLLASNECSRIPLCRLIPYARVQGLRQDVGCLKIAFQYKNYVPEKGAFIVSILKENGEENQVSDEVRASWYPLWQEVDSQFEKDLSGNSNWEFMKHKMFFVWEGNHRTTAWMQVIIELDIEMEVATNTVKYAHETRELAKDDILLFKELCVFAYSMVSPSDLAYCGDAPFYGCDVGDYIAMGQNFVSEKKNEVYTRTLEFFLAIGIRKDYCRMGRKVKWAADFIFLDFPPGFGLESIQGVPRWNRLTKEHVRYEVTVAATSLSDHGWLVMMASLKGSCITWIEQYIHIQGLRIGCRVFVLDKVAYGLVNEEGENISLRSHVHFFVHNLNTHPKKFYDASKAIYKKLHILQDSDWWTHFLPDAKKIVLFGMVAIRGPMERSPAFMEAVLALLCPEDGLVLEMIYGTSPLMKAWQATGRACFSFDNDVGIVNLVTLPIVQAITCNKRVCLESEAKHEDDEVNPVSNTYD